MTLALTSGFFPKGTAPRSSQCSLGLFVTFQFLRVLIF